VNIEENRSVSKLVQGKRFRTGWLWRKIAYDNGLEFSNLELANDQLNCKSYFCTPYSSTEKESVEDHKGTSGNWRQHRFG